MDVHDVGTRTTPLQPGMAFTIEPGIYIREAALDNLPKTSENQAFIDKVRAAVEKYKDIGVRVEDSFLLTATGVENLSAGVPRTIDAIEQFLKPVGSPAGNHEVNERCRAGRRDSWSDCA